MDTAPTPAPLLLPDHDAFLAARLELFGDPAMSHVAAALVAVPPRADAIDVSRYQLRVDWPTVRAHTGPLVFYKISQGGAYVDPYYRTNRDGTAAAEFTRRVGYHWISPDVPASVQAAHVARTAGALVEGEGLMLDAEQTGITEPLTREVAVRLEDAYQRPAAIYTGRYVAGGALWFSTALFNGHRPRVFAAYTTPARARSIASPHAWDVWQWTGTGRVPGVSTLVDINQVDNLSIFDAVCGITNHLQEDPVQAIEPQQRLVDTRENTYPDGMIPTGRLHAGQTIAVPIFGNDVVVNLTIVNPSARGWATVYGKTKPPTSNVNYEAGQTIANSCRSRTDGGLLHIFVSAECDVIVDLQAAG